MAASDKTVNNNIEKYNEIQTLHGIFMRHFSDIPLTGEPTFNMNDTKI